MERKAVSDYRSLTVAISFKCILFDPDGIFNTQIDNSLTESIKVGERLIACDGVDDHFIDICFDVAHYV